MSLESQIKVLVVDDHAMVREGLITFLKVFSDLLFIGEAESGAEAVLFCKQMQPDVILMDMMMPEMDGPTAIKHIHIAHPNIQIIALTSFGQEDLIKAALQGGATSYLLKNIGAAELATAIRAAYAGRSTFAPEVTKILYRASVQPPQVGHDLTSRERQVLGLIVKGYSNALIADHLMVSKTTVKGHLNNIFSKLNVNNRTEAATMALQQNIVLISE